jgi:hypothetical protein
MLPVTYRQQCRCSRSSLLIPMRQILETRIICPPQQLPHTQITCLPPQLPLQHPPLRIQTPTAPLSPTLTCNKGKAETFNKLCLPSQLPLQHPPLRIQTPTAPLSPTLTCNKGKAETFNLRMLNRCPLVGFSSLMPLAVIFMCTFPLAKCHGCRPLCLFQPTSSRILLLSTGLSSAEALIYVQSKSNILKFHSDVEKLLSMVYSDA